jgi:HEAT repeat protein
MRDMVMTASALLVFFLFGAGIPAQEPATENKKAEAMLADFQKFSDNQNVHVRKAAADTLATCNHPTVIKPVLASLAAEQDGIVRTALAQILAAQTSQAAVTELVRLLQVSNNLNERVAILNAFKKSKPQFAYETVLRLTENKTFELRFLAADVLGSLKSEDGRSEKALIALTADPETQIRAVAFDSIKELKAASAAPRCIEIIGGDDDWPVRAAAIAALRSFRIKEAIQPLIDLMKKKDEGRLCDDAHAALKDLTGFNYSANPEVWQGWWTRVQATYKVPTELELRDQKKLEDKAMEAYSKKTPGYTTYQGIKTKSRRMLFVLDVSESMSEDVVTATPDPERLAAFRERFGPYETKIELAREQLINTIAVLESHVRFNIVTFHTDVKLWRPKLVSASDGNKNEAIKFLARLTPESVKVKTQGKGRTNTFDALNVAFGISKQPQDKPTKDHTVESDTVFFLTDGIPSVGRITDPEEFVRYFKTVNARAKLVFHTITFGHGNIALLKPMSDSSGGQYLEINI